MFIGHVAVALAAKRVAPSVSLSTLFLAAQLANLIWPTLVLLGIEVVEVRPGINVRIFADVRDAETRLVAGADSAA